MSFVINVLFELNAAPEDLGLDLEQFPLRIQNAITNEELVMEVNVINKFLIRRMPNDIVDWQPMQNYVDSLLALPTIGIGKWVCLLFRFFFIIKEI